MIWEQLGTLSLFAAKIAMSMKRSDVSSDRADLFQNIDPVLSIIVILVTSNLLIRSELQNILAWPSYGKCNIQKPNN